MFLIRQAKPSDADTLLKLAKMVHFINLPADKDVISDKIRLSSASFAAARGEQSPATPSAGTRNGAARGSGAAGRSPQYMFVLEDLETNNPLGTSAIIETMGMPGNPNIGMQLRKRQVFSKDLQMGVTHVTAQVFLEENGPTEIGGLILGPSYRGHPAKLGKQLSLVRFHYIGLRRAHFRDRLLAEMMGPITPDGGNTLWEYLGRRFINLSYAEADRFCAYSREFMISLLPREEIYLTLLPPEARPLIGQVGPETQPARAMLEKLGFVYRDRIDPFDGGPHLEAMTDEIQLVKSTRRLKFAGVLDERETESLESVRGFVSVEGDEVSDDAFRAVYTPYTLENGGASLRLPEEAAALLDVKKGAEVGLTPVEGPASSAPRPAETRRDGRKKPAAGRKQRVRG